MFGLHPDGSESAGPMDLVRLAIPRRVYTQSHIDYVAEVVLLVAAKKDQLRGYRIASAPKILRHFTAAFEPLPPEPPAGKRDIKDAPRDMEIPQRRIRRSPPWVRRSRSR